MAQEQNEVLERLKRIEAKLDKAQKTSTRQSGESLGFATIIASAAFVQQSIWLSVILFGLGYLMIILSSRSGQSNLLKILSVFKR